MQRDIRVILRLLQISPNQNVIATSQLGAVSTTSNQNVTATSQIGAVSTTPNKNVMAMSQLGAVLTTPNQDAIVMSQLVVVQISLNRNVIGRRIAMKTFFTGDEMSLCVMLITPTLDGSNYVTETEHMMYQLRK